LAGCVSQHTASPAIYTLSLHDALPISLGLTKDQRVTVSSTTGTIGPVLVRPYSVSRGSVVMYYPEVNKIISRSVDPVSRTPAFRSEEHTSELQSRENLVCRLLLEKKRQ